MDKEETFVFGDMVEAPYASEDNPLKRGIFVGYTNHQGQKCLQVTDGKGKFWEVGSGPGGVDNLVNKKVGRVIINIEGLKERDDAIRFAIEAVGTVLKQEATLTPGPRSDLEDALRKLKAAYEPTKKPDK